MPKIKIEKTTEISSQDAFHKIKNFLSNDPDLKKLDPSYECQFDEPSLSGKATGKKFNAQMQVEEQNGKGVITIMVDLPLLLGPFKGLVENTLNKKLGKLLG